MLTKEEFLRRYAARSDTTVELLAERNLEAYPCQCGEVGCQGWQMMDRDIYDMRVKDGVEIRRRS